jgi:cytidine deaminase
MSKRILQVVSSEYKSLSELPIEYQNLVNKARNSSDNAYAPYSHFSVGAAVLLENGESIIGNNQENADFTDGLCAERVALFAAHSVFPKIAVKAIAVSAKNKNGLIPGPSSPCGSCRQVLIESEARFKRNIKIILDGAEKIVILDGADSLLPFAFKPDSLG